MATVYKKQQVVQDIPTDTDGSASSFFSFFALYLQALCHLAEQQGQEQARLQAKEEAKVWEMQWQQRIHHIAKAIEQNRKAQQEEVADLVFAILQKLYIQKQYSEKAIRQEIQYIVEHIQKHQRMEVYLHPNDLEILQSQQYKPQPPMTLHPDTSLLLGGVKIVTEHGLFNFSIEDQIDRLKEALLFIKREKQHG